MPLWGTSGTVCWVHRRKQSCLFDTVVSESYWTPCGQKDSKRPRSKQIDLKLLDRYLLETAHLSEMSASRQLSSRTDLLSGGEDTGSGRQMLMSPQGKGTKTSPPRSPLFRTLILTQSCRHSVPSWVSPLVLHMNKAGPTLQCFQSNLYRMLLPKLLYGFEMFLIPLQKSEFQENSLPWAAII